MSRDSRLTFIGLWTLCDDAGYFELKPRQIAFQLFPYDDDRLGGVDAALGELAGIGSVVALECGLHAIVPSMPVHGQKGGNHAFTFRERHAADCSGGSDQQQSGPVRTRPDKPAGSGGAVVRTRPDSTPKASPPPQVRTRPDESSSDSESVSDSDTTKKNVLDEVVEGINGARELDPDARFFSDPNRAGRRDASPGPSPRPAFTVPPGIAAVTPRWRNPCTDYIHHASKHRIVDGVAQCDICEEQLVAGAAKTNGVDHGDQAGFGLA
jgi:hypothetical protein